jgi:predicted ATPase
MVRRTDVKTGRLRRFDRIVLKNWRNFLHVDVELPYRTFLVGPNAIGKSNLLDVFRFLRDIVTPGGGLQAAVITKRDGVSRIRCLGARGPKAQDIEIEVAVSGPSEEAGEWIYKLCINQDNNQKPYVKEEKVICGDNVILERPDLDDENDPVRLSQTALEQTSVNIEFREVAEFFRTVRYLHLVPQIIRNPDIYGNPDLIDDPYGSDFLERIAKTNGRTQESRLNKILKALEISVPNISKLYLEKDKKGVPHIIGKYKHWRAKEAKQDEKQFSDGTVRLIGFLWALLDGDGPLLLEEPELSLHPGVVTHLAPLIHRVQISRKTRRQVIISTHSVELLSDKGIGGNEVLLLVPGKESTEVKQAVWFPEIKSLLESGLSVGEVAFPRTEPLELVKLDEFQ